MGDQVRELARLKRDIADVVAWIQRQANASGQWKRPTDNRPEVVAGEVELRLAGALSNYVAALAAGAERDAPSEPSEAPHEIKFPCPVCHAPLGQWVGTGPLWVSPHVDESRVRGAEGEEPSEGHAYIERLGVPGVCASCFRAPSDAVAHPGMAAILRVARGAERDALYRGPYLTPPPGVPDDFVLVNTRYLADGDKIAEVVRASRGVEGEEPQHGGPAMTLREVADAEDGGQSLVSSLRSRVATLEAAAWAVWRTATVGSEAWAVLGKVLGRAVLEERTP